MTNIKTKDMRLVRFLMILFFLFVVSKVNAQTSDDNIQAISVKIDSTYYEPIYKDILNKMTDYSYYKNGKKTGNTVEVNIADDGLVRSIKIDCKDENLETLGCYMSLEDMMSGLKCVMDDITKRYGIDNELIVKINTLDFGDGSVDLCRQYDKKAGKKGTGVPSVFSKVCLKSKLVRSLRKLMAQYGKEHAIEHPFVSDGFVYNILDYVSPEIYTNFYKYEGNKNELPEKMFYSTDLLMVFRDKEK